MAEDLLVFKCGRIDMVGGIDEIREEMFDSMRGRLTIIEGVSRVLMLSPILGA